uniref:Putative D14 protein n=1 Tax=Chlorokybus atmophyticus TaxID=3144 RepID=I6PEW0_CHLAT|nr:putative D14 protein [Chlorokybus atmophyticus]
MYAPERIRGGVSPDLKRHLDLSGPLARRHKAKLYGRGETLVVLAHGLGADQSSWQRILPGLVEDCRVLVFDAACALTNDEDYDFRRYGDLHGYAEDVLELFAEIDVQNCVYIGASLSANAGMLASIEQPHRFKKLIAICGAPGYVNLPEENFHGPFSLEDLERVFASMHENYLAWVAGFAPRVVCEDNSEAIEEFSRHLISMRPDVAISVSRTAFLTDFRDALSMVEIPCVLLQGREDLAVPEEVTQYMAARLPKCMYEILPTRGHIPHMSAPGIVLSALRRHIPG